MVIISEDLRDLVNQFGIAPLQSVDQFSITLKLSEDIAEYNIKDDDAITYGTHVPDKCVKRSRVTRDIILNPGGAILGCSDEQIRMPKGYIGFIQTKGSLARLFVTVDCNDGQIEPGFNGRITFEICNMGTIPVRLIPHTPVAQLFILRASSDKEGYSGQYKDSDIPTFSNNKR